MRKILRNMKKNIKGVFHEVHKISWPPISKTMKNFGICLLFCSIICGIFTIYNTVISLVLKVLGGML